MAKPWDLRHPCHKGFERLNQLWHAAYAEPRTLGRTLLQAHLAEKRARRAAEPALDYTSCRDSAIAVPRDRGGGLLEGMHDAGGV
eukprot:scaffold89137_cov69-Phaeocystis_antarctica.AAC.4